MRQERDTSWPRDIEDTPPQSFDQHARRDRALEKKARDIERKRLDVEDKELQLRLKQLERANKRGCCCSITFLILIAAPLLTMAGLATVVL
jgi:hypothetical protein